MIIDLVTGLGRLNVIATIAIIGASILFSAFVLRCVSSVLRQVAIDAIEVYTRWQSARLDVRLGALERRAKLSIWRDNARQSLSDHRLRLRGGHVPNGNGYVK